MKISVILLLISLQTFAIGGFSQKITLDVKNEKLGKVLRMIENQTGYRFTYSNQVLPASKAVTLQVKDEDLQKVLDALFKDLQLDYREETGKLIVIFQKSPISTQSLTVIPSENEESQTIDVHGRVVNENGEPVAGASVQVKGDKSNGTSTNATGYFELNGIDENAILIITGINIEQFYVRVNGSTDLGTITVKTKIATLDETIVQAYGTTTRRLALGNINKVKGEDITKQPVPNLLAALEARAPGLIITQNSGIPGAPFKVQIRGQSSIAQNSDPLFIIDGVPFAPGNNSVSAGITSMIGLVGPSPFSSINPSDIESIEILKDADATAIYGSRGAGGVILITTKKGKTGKTQFNLNAYSGQSKVTRTMSFMNTPQYLQMRHEAFANDNEQPGPISAYDLLLFDTTRYTDFTKYFIGGAAATNDMQASLNGGDFQNKFFASLGYHNETTVFPGNMKDGRVSSHVQFSHRSADNKFSASFTAFYSYENNDLITRDLTQYSTLPPDWFSFFDAAGALVWQYQGLSFDNPMSYLFKTYRLQSANLNAGLQLQYRILSDLALRVNLGYNDLRTDELEKIPQAAQSPGSISTALFGKSFFNNWIVEPQLEYSSHISKGELTILAGSSFLNNTSSSERITASNYTNDALLGSLAAAGSITARSNAFSDYKYVAAFGRITYNWLNKYLLNISGRRDGSSRFGTGKQFADFGSAGAGWIMTNEHWFHHNSILSYGKVRISYGSSGNDKIGDYRYLNTWASYSSYQGNGTLYPSALYNPDYSWEINRKLESALETGFFKDRILFSIAWYRNRTNNQLLQYALPSQTGFTSVISNFPALVQNSGWELEGTFENIRTKNFSWSSSFNLTFPKNKLVSFPGLETSSYSSLVIGQPLSVYGGFHFLGVDPQTGLYSYADKQSSPTSNPSESQDWIKNLGNLEPQFYGGFQNTVSYKNFQLTCFFDFRKQPGLNFLYQLGTKIPGMIGNLPVQVLDRWQHPGDKASFQMYTQSYLNPAFTAASNFGIYNSDGKYGDASFIRLKNLSLSYSFKKEWLKKWWVQEGRIYLQCQNLFTITRYKGADPETQNLTALPPLRTITGGINLTF
jgi:TonB-linked SusC/RagA family outer membrane protein